MGYKPAMNSAVMRERELYRYYQPDGTINVNDEDARKSSNDPILTAFAQLGALRMRARRGVITLSSACQEWVIAEAGQSISLQQDNDEQDKLWHGIGALDCGTGAGPELASWFCRTGENVRVVKDASQDEFFKDKEVVRDGPHARFMASSPLRTSRGVVIGTYVIVDDKPRDGISEADQQFMVDMGVTVMDYLQSGLVKRKQQRSETMIKAMGLFIEGKSTLREWWLEFGHKHTRGVQKRSKNSTSIEEQANEEFGVQDPSGTLLGADLNGLTDDTKRPSLSKTPSSTTASVVDMGDGRPNLPRGQSHLSTTDSSLPVGSAMSLVMGRDRQSSVTTGDIDSGTDDIAPQHRGNSVSFDLPPEVDSINDFSKGLQDAVLNSDLRNVFARASNLIREAIGVDGVVYYDASVGSFGGSSDRSVMDEKAPGAFKVDGANGQVTEISGVGRKPSVISLGGTTSDNAQPSSSETEAAPEKCCNILGFSTRRRSTLKNHPTFEEHRRFPESALRRLLKRYPHGKVFNFDEDGQMLSESDLTSSSAESRPSEPTPIERRVELKRQAKEAEGKAILKIFPQARSVFWFPLWDSSRDRWFSGSFVWSTSPTRTFCPVEDLTYLASFSNSVMAEVARISALVSAQMKTDFISSISHELRSPLHGILASVEFLQETEMDETQNEMVGNIHASGKVLLDTINHVLDFSKVNRKSKTKDRFIKKPGKRSKKVRDRGDSVVDQGSDISVLSEEVIESVYAGHRVKKHAFGSHTDRHLSAVPTEAPVSVIVDIAWRPNWFFDVDAGAWRRILMNLFNNSMKYTKTGFVKISLEVEEDVASRSKQQRSNLILKVSDSGKGISQEFLRHQLFKPFKQEDSLASGTGLGLAIIRHVIQELGGRIDVTSEPGTGTEATVQLPLQAQPPVTTSTEPELLTEVRDLTQGFKFSLEGFERYPDLTEEPTGILTSDVEAAMHLKAATTSVLTDWFNMTTSPPTEISTADLVIVMEAGLVKKNLNDILKSYGRDRKAGSRKPVAVVLCDNYHAAAKIENHEVFDVVHLQQPYCPHKLAKTLHKVLVSKQNGVTTPNQNGSDAPPQVQPSPSSPNEVSEPFSQPPTTYFPQTTSSPFVDQPEVQSATGLWSPSQTSEPNGLWNQSRSKALSPGSGTSPKSEAPHPLCPSKSDEGLRVLLVEDNEINLKLLVAYMRKLKLEHATAINGLQALDTYKDQEGKFNVIFMDISMPVMDGIESSKNIRRFERENSLPPVVLIALTGAANPNTRQEAFSSGVDLFLTKPVPMKQLKVMLEDLRKNGRDGLSNDGYDDA